MMAETARSPSGQPASAPPHTRSASSQIIGRETVPRPLRFAIMAVAIMALLSALWAGLLRAGWTWPTPFNTLPPGHGPLMVCGFLATVIGLERAVGLGHRWAFAAPILSAAGALALIAGAPTDLSALLCALGSLVLVVVLVQLLRIQIALYLVAIVLGALCLFAGNLLWLFGWPIPVAALWWVAFLVITVSGERLELSRMLRLSTCKRSLYAFALGLLILAPIVGLADYAMSMHLLGIALIAMAVWLLSFDIAWRRLRAGGQARYTAVCLLTGYAWLAVAGVIALTLGGPMAGPVYDAILHAVFLGFVFSMIFGHAPIIFPAVLQLPVRYVPPMYIPLVTLQLSLALRIAGDLVPWYPARLWGALLGALSILLFLVILASTVVLRAGDATAARRPA